MKGNRFLSLLQVILLLSLGLLRQTAAMAADLSVRPNPVPGPNPNISNGTCYWAPGQTMNQAFVPCGNGALGHKLCCQANDLCVGLELCRSEFGFHYLAGCTDPSFADKSACPIRGVGSTLPWIGVVVVDANNLFACWGSGRSDVVTALPDCTTSSAYEINSATVNPFTFELSTIGRVPASTGMSFDWYGTHSLPTSSDPRHSTVTRTTTVVSVPSRTSRTTSGTAAEPVATTTPRPPVSTSTALPKTPSGPAHPNFGVIFLIVTISLLVVVLVSIVLWALYKRYRGHGLFNKNNDQQPPRIRLRRLAPKPRPQPAASTSTQNLLPNP